MKTVSIVSIRKGMDLLGDNQHFIQQFFYNLEWDLVIHFAKLLSKDDSIYKSSTILNVYSS